MISRAITCSEMLFSSLESYSMVLKPIRCFKKRFYVSKCKFIDSRAFLCSRKRFHSSKAILYVKRVISCFKMQFLVETSIACSKIKFFHLNYVQDLLKPHFYSLNRSRASSSRFSSFTQRFQSKSPFFSWC